MNDSSSRRPLTDRPWFWVHCFALAGLAGMLVMGDKFERRQSQLDGNFERRISSLAGEGESSSRAEGSARFVRFGPLAIGLAAAAAISWWLMWREGSSERSPNESEK